jgi:hypothetical protein
MTLNITVAARWMMAQSSDFRLTTSGGGAVLSDIAQKQIVLQYRGWSGLICYTGVAQWGAHDTAQWLTQVLTHSGGERTVRQVIALMVREGNSWLRLVPRNQRSHSFTLITYENRVPHVYVISNFERGGQQPLPDSLDGLVVSHIRPRGPRCVVTGWSTAVTKEQRRGLEQVLAGNPSSLALRTAVANTSRVSSRRAEDRVSESCVVAHLLPDGSGEAQVFGNLNGPFSPSMITRGVNVATYIPDILNDAQAKGPARLVGVTWTSNGATSAMLAGYRELANQRGDGWPGPEGTNSS